MNLKSRSCPLCHSREGRVLFSDRNRREGLGAAGSYVKCRLCGMIYLTPIPDFRAMELDEFDCVYRVSRAEARFPRIARLVLGGARRAAGVFDRSARYHGLPRGNGLRRDGTSRRILDVGCTDGAKLRPFAQRGWEVYGVDLTSSALATARRTLPNGHFFLGHVDEVGLPPASFDAIRADAVLEHVDDPVGFLRSLRRLLRPDGQLLLYIPNGDSFCTRLLKRGSINSWVPFHVNLFTSATIGRALTAAGLAPAAIKQNTPVSWLLLSARQSVAVLVGRNSFSTRLSPAWDIARLVAAPLAAALNAARLGEELVVIAQPRGTPESRAR